jgi:integrase
VADLHSHGPPLRIPTRSIEPRRIGAVFANAPIEPACVAVQVLRISFSAGGNRYEAVYVLAPMLGMRPGEILGLRWSDVSLETRTLRISQSLPRLRSDSEERGKKTQLRATETKNDGSKRSIALPD